MKLIEINVKYSYAWVWRFLLYWGDEIEIVYYPDKETAAWWVTLRERQK